ncbi:hypothetical protein FRB93_012771 [Tulasnella sp. JGI-2019a]|nr:hypothetical protein FRB93_012771 [Tulasnella sp. JGI-2019a]
MFSWETVKDQVDSGNLDNLKRHPDLQARYENWTREIACQYGSAIHYLLQVKLGWDPLEVKTEVPGPVVNHTATEAKDGEDSKPVAGAVALGLPTPSPIGPYAPVSNAGGTSPEYFSANMPPHFYQILRNEWPYSVPVGVEHFVFWTRVPIIHPAIASACPKIWPLIERDGLWGFTGSNRTPAPRILDHEFDAAPVQEAHQECATFVMKHWPTDSWETAWLVNPLSIQSLPGLSHGHVLARKK